MIDRRLFVQGISAAALAAASGHDLVPQDDRPVRLGIIGPGSRGKELVRCFLRVPGVSIVAAADVYEPRFAQLNQLCEYNVASYKDYGAMLDRKDLDAVIVAAPLGLHATHILAALHSGRHVYGEKTMCFTLAEASQMVEGVQSGTLIYQVGHQYRYAPWIRASIERALSGEIGEITHVFGYWHRNGDWRRPVPDPALERLINWRLYNQWSLGLLAELASHHIDLANWIFGEAPQAALATGSIANYHDGRENDDNVQAILSYSRGRRFIFSSLTDNAKMGDQLWVYGTRGSLNITLQDAEFFYEPKKVTQVVTGPEGKGVVTGASYRPEGEMPYRGPGKALDVPVLEDATNTACRGFIESVRTGKKPLAGIQEGYRAAIAVITANQSIKERKEIPIVAEI